MKLAQRLTLAATAAAIIATTTGCIGISVSKTNFGRDADAVAVDGHVYLVNKTTGRVYRVDISDAEPWHPSGEDDDD